MADVSKDASLITVHGREGLNLPYARYMTDRTGRETQIDISASVIFIEIPAAHLRKQLIANPGDVKALLIQLSRDEVGQIPVTECDFVIVDETAAVPDVEWSGKIKRIGYTGAPT